MANFAVLTLQCLDHRCKDSTDYLQTTGGLQFLETNLARLRKWSTGCLLKVQGRTL